MRAFFSVDGLFCSKSFCNVFTEKCWSDLIKQDHALPKSFMVCLVLRFFTAAARLSDSQ